MIKTDNIYRVALVIQTSNLDYDDRVRKELVSIKELYPNVQFQIFALYNENKSEEGVTSYGIPYKVYYLKSRDKYVSASHLFKKAWEFYSIVKPELRMYDAIWCADFHVFLFALLLHGKPILWDLHELPYLLIGSWWKRLLFRIIENKSNVIIHANQPRLDYLKKIGMVKHPEKHFVIRNYPDFNEVDTVYDETYQAFDKWLGNDKCVYLQGINNSDRADMESISAVMCFEELKAVIVGRIDDTLYERLMAKFGKEAVEKRLFFTGMIKQLKTPQYIRRSFMSLVFYKNTSMNNWYCEPNRFFQNIINGNPVVVGNNPPMKELVEKFGVGICARTDGTDVTMISEAIASLMNQYETLKKNCLSFSEKIMWHNQETTIQKVMNTFI